MADAGEPRPATAEGPPPAPDVVPDVRRLAHALCQLPEGDRAAVLAHVEALATMSPAKRAALLTLTGGDGQP